MSHRIRPVSIVRVAALGALLLGALLLAPGLARAAAVARASDASGTVSLDQPAYTANENQGTLTITIVRTGDTSVPEHVGYGVKQQDARNGVDFTAIPNTYITIPAGQSTYQFQVAIIDRGMNATPVHALAYLYGAWPDPIGANNNSLVTILHDDPLGLRDPTDPLGVPANVSDNPLAGTRFYIDPDSGAAKAQTQLRHSRPAWSRMLGVLSSSPGAHRFYMWNMVGNIAGQVSHYLQDTQIQDPGSTVMLSTYNLVHDHCGYTATPAIESRYENFMSQVAQGIGNYNVVFFLELDSTITAPCLTRAQLAIRDAELKYAITALDADPHVLVYLDGGAADANSAAREAA
ncbi:MAG: glycoside hydrolase family 6 protein, partial [Solirubrobacteraceae bacterium]